MKNMKKRILAALGAVAVAGGIVASMVSVPASANNGPTSVSDPNSLNRWQTRVADSTRNTGRIWTDKTVAGKEGIELLYGQAQGATVKPLDGADFVVALSALSSTSSETTVQGNPLDIVMVLDVSGSMEESRMAVYDIDTANTYYVQVTGNNGTSYQAVTYNDRYGGWRRQYDNVTYQPKTSAADNSNNRVQFYGETRMEAVQSAATSFIDATIEANKKISEANKQHRIGLVKFAGNQNDTNVGDNTYTVRSGQNTYTFNYSQVVSWMVDSEQEMNQLKTAVNALEGNGSTRASYGLNQAERVFNNGTERTAGVTAQKVVVFFTDGEPNGYSSFWQSEAANTVTQAKALKDAGAKIYSVGVVNGANSSVRPANATIRDSVDINYYLHAVSSNYPAATASYTGTDSQSNQNAVWTLNPGTASTDEGGELTNYYKTATSAAELNSIFVGIFDAEASAPADPITTTSTDPNAGRYITFEDTLGDFMEVKGVNGVVFESASGVKSIFDKVTESGDSVVTYDIDGVVSTINTVYKLDNYDMSNLKIQVQRGNTAQQGDKVTVQLPSELLPLRHYYVAQDGKLTITEATPVRILYSVGLKDEVRQAMESGKLTSVTGLAEYANTTSKDGQVSFYSNAWTEGDRGSTTASFVPNTSNEFYYYTENTYLYLDDDCTQMLTTAPVAGTTYYYKHPYHEINSADQTVNTHTGISVTVTASGIQANVAYDAQKVPYIKANTPKISMSGAVSFHTNKNDMVTSGSGNLTGTAQYVIVPTLVSGRAINYLGNNGKLSYNSTGSLSISKQVAYENGLTPDPDAEFTFDLELTKPTTWAADETVDGLYPYTITKEEALVIDGGVEALADTPKSGVLRISGGKVTALYVGGSLSYTTNDDGTVTETLNQGSETKTALTLKAGEVITIHSIREDVTYSVKESTTMPAGFALTGLTQSEDGTTAKVLDNPANGATGDIATAITEAVAFTNTYSITTPFSFPETPFPVQKTVKTINNTNVTWETDWAFTFRISSPTGAPLPKTASGQDADTITLRAADVKDSVAQGVFEKIQFTAPGEYVYLIIEENWDVSDAKMAGLSRSFASYEVTVTVRDTGNGTLEAVVLDEDGQPILVDGQPKQYVLKKVVGEENETNIPREVTEALFVNTYDLGTATWVPPVSKRVNDQASDSYVAPAAGMFRFEMSYNEGLSTSGAAAKLGGTATNTAGGDVPLPSVTFNSADKDKTFVFDIEEQNTGEDGYTIDSTLYRAKVHVTESTVDGKTVLAAVPTYYKIVGNQEVEATLENGRLPFVNTYDPAPASAALNVRKTFTGRSWLDTDNFTFTLSPNTSATTSDSFYLRTTTDADGKEILEAVKGAAPAGTTSATATAIVGKPADTAADKTVNTAAFANILFDKVGVYSFNVTETVPANKQGITYDTHVGRVTVTVTNSGEGALTASAVYDGNTTLTASEFTNTYSASSVTVPELFSAAKYFDRDPETAGRQWASGDQFLFRRLNADGSSVISTDTITTQENAAAGEKLPTTSLGGETFTAPGTYTYYLYERLGTGQTGTDGQGETLRTLIPGVTYSRFVYKVEVVISDWKNGDSFVEQNAANGAPSGELGIVDIRYYRSATELSADVNASIKTLADMTALKYETEETTQLQDIPGEALVKSVIFSNQYIATPVTIPGTGNTAIHGIKTMVGRAMTENESFTFTLAPAENAGFYLDTLEGVRTAVKGAGTTETMTSTVTGLGNGASQRFDFGEITFTKPGVYQFTMKENAPDQDGNDIYDRHIGTVTVTVTDDYTTGKLVAQVAYADNSFINLYNDFSDAKKVTNAEGKDINGQLVSAGQELTYTIKWVNTATANGQPAPAAVTITDAIPANTTFVSANGGVQPENGVLTWNIDAAAGAQGTVSFTVKVSQTLTSGADIENTGSITIGERYPQVTNTVTNYVPGKSGKLGDTEITTTSDIKVGDILTFTVNYKNTEKAPAQIIVTDTLNDGLTYADNMAVFINGQKIETGFTFSQTGQTLTWTIASVPAETAGSVTFRARVNEDAPKTVNPITNTASIRVGENSAAEVKTNTVTIPTPGTGNLTISKTVNVAQGYDVTAPNSDFTFTVSLEDTSGTALTGTYAYTTSDGRQLSMVSGGSITLKAGQTATITGLPVGASYTVTETKVAGFAQTAPANGVAATGTIVTAGADAAFTNTFTPATFDSNITVRKVLVDNFTNGNVVAPWPNDYTFRMVLVPGTEGAPMPATGLNALGNYVMSVNKDNPTVELPKIEFTQANKTYTYYLHELHPQSSADRQLGVSYSHAVYQLEIAVDGNLGVTSKLIPYKDSLGNLIQSTDVTADEAVFYNEYNLNTVVWAPRVRKTLVNNSGAALDYMKYPFVFQGELLSGREPIPAFDSNKPGDELASKQATVYGAGEDSFRTVTFTEDHLAGNPTEVKSYYYRFYEIKGDISGVEYDDAACFVKLDLHMQKDDSVSDGSKDALILNGTYYKQVTDKHPAPSGVTTEELTLPDGTKVNVYKLTSTADTTMAMEFTNVYDPADASAQMGVTKTLTGRDWQDGETFSFQLLGADGGVIETITMAEDDKGVKNFSEITYNKVGTYTYTIKEVIPETPVGGMTYDARSFPVTVTVTDKDADGNYTGALAATVTYGSGAPAFENKYSMTAVQLENAFPVSKTLTGRNWQTGDHFDFVIDVHPTYPGANPMPEDAEGNVIKSITVSKNGETVDFGTITFTAPGMYYYVVKEARGAISGVSYDSTVYEVRVVVTDNGDGTLTAVPQINGSETWEVLSTDTSLSFTNKYSTTSVTAPINVVKTLRGVNEWYSTSNYSFGFKLTAVDGAPMPANTTVTIAGNGETGDVTGITKSESFGSISYDKPGTYTYKVEEIIPDPKDSHIIYDQVPVEVKVVVTDDNAGKLHAQVYYDGVLAAANDGAVFVNVYTAPGRPQKSVANTTRKIDGNMAMPGDVLTYTINWLNTTGQDNATVVIEDTIPTGTTYVSGSATSGAVLHNNPQKLVWTISNVPAGGTGRVTFRVTVNQNAPDTVTNFASINGVETNITTTTVPQKKVSKMAPGIGEEITYTITYKNPHDTPATVTITDELDKRLTYVSADNNGVYSSENHTVTWVVENVGAGGTGSVALVAKLNELAVADTENLEYIPNDAIMTIADVDYRTNEVNVPEVSVGSLHISKTLNLPTDMTAEETAQHNAKEFQFKVTLMDAGGTAISKFDCTIDSVSKTVTDGILKLKSGQTAVIAGLPVGTTYLVEEILETGTSYIPEEASKTGTITNTAVNVEFVNKYDPDYIVGGFDVTAAKNLTGRDMVAGEFEFAVFDVNGDPVAVGVNGADGKVTFQVPVAMFALALDEEPLEPVVPTISTNSENLFIALKDTDILTAEELALLAQGEAVDVQLVMTKIGEMITETDRELVASAVPGEVVDENLTMYFNLVLNKTVGAGETVTLSSTNAPVTLTFQGVGGYRLARISGDTIAILEDLDGGDNGTITVQTQNLGTFVLISAAEEEVDETVPETSEPTEPTDPTAPTDPTETEPKETEPKETEPKETEPKETEPKETEPKETEPKETEPKETEPKETEPKETEPKETEPKETEPKETEPKETEPKVTEPKETEPKETEPKETEPKETEPKETEPKETELKETEPKVTEPKETQGDEEDAAKDAAETILAAQVNYSVIYLSNVEESPSQPTDTPDETQKTSDEPETTSLEPETEKKDIIIPRTVSALTASTFLTTVEPIAEGETGNDPLIKPADVGTFEYTIREIDNDIPGVTYDTTVYKVKVNVTKQGDQLICKPTYYKVNADTTETEVTAVVFNNSYKAADSDPVTISGTKTLTGKTLTAGAFEFELVQDETVLQTMKNNANGQFTFTLSGFDKVGEYDYIVREKNTRVLGVNYDTKEYTVTVTVTDDDSGQLKTAVTGADNIQFNNTYSLTPATLTLKATKKLTGRDMLDSEFSFLVRDKSYNLVATGANSKDGEIVFSTMTFQSVGTYTLRVSEVKGTQSGVTYDTTEYEVKVVVVADGNNALKIESVTGADNIVFNNTYKATNSNPDDSNPKTGDDLPLLLMICFTSAASLTLLMKDKKRWLGK